MPKRPFVQPKGTLGWGYDIIDCVLDGIVCGRLVSCIFKT